MLFYISKIVWFLITPSNFFLVVAALGLVLGGLLRWRPRFWLGLSTGALVVLFVLGLSPAANWLMAPLENRFPEWRAEGVPDGIVVLGGSITTLVSGDRKIMALNESAERVTAMITLAVRYPEAKLVFTGGGSGFFDHGTTEAAVARDLFQRSGLDPARLLLEDRALNTRQNAIFSRAVADPKPGERWLLVTSAFHMPRAVGAFRAAGFPVDAYPVDFRTAGLGADKGFVSVADGLKRADTAVKEWVGLVAYRALGRSETLFPAP